MPTELTKHHKEGFTFAEVPVDDILAGRYDQLDPDCVNLLKTSVDRMPWRLYVHQPYPVSSTFYSHPAYTHPFVSSASTAAMLAFSVTQRTP